MKHLFATFVALVFSATRIDGGGAYPPHPLIKDCRIVKEYGFASKVFDLYGDVRIVTDPDEWADFDVKINEVTAALYVKKVETRPRKCGEWRFVDSSKHADFTISIVAESEDFTVCFVDSDPGSAY